MFASLVSATVRILFFRAGPQDFPYEPRLTLPIAVAAAGVNALMFVQVLPVATSLLLAAALVAGFAMTTRALLRARNLDARFHQTYAALLATNAVLTLALLPFFAQIAPTLRELASNPQLLEHPDKFKLPQSTAFIMNMLNFWSIGVMAWIFRNAANLSILLGLLLTFVVGIVLLFFLAFISSFAGLLLGGA
ncbi:hypothetical protein [Solimonas marina]|uniref:Yip1 domain-containing protein n=1 Tax=Solimonas marina TaxID=2714601 RepID=A0A969W934_9GAMM|nr:hypothetical protein [Solimonas marina]NKF22892.1 hypothetical protein [Solimonas marina]